jgi:hypothetical protein
MTYGIIYIDGEPCPVTNMIDAFGEETTDKSECEVVVVHHLAEDSWVTIQVKGSELYPVQ